MSVHLSRQSYLSQEIIQLSRAEPFECFCLRDGPGDNTTVPQSLCSVAGPGHDAPVPLTVFFCLSHRMPEVAPIAVGTHLVVGDPPTQSLSQLLVPRTTMFGSFGGGSQHSHQRPRLRVLLHFHLIEKTVKHNLWLDPPHPVPSVDAPQFASALSRCFVRSANGRNSNLHQAFRPRRVHTWLRHDVPNLTIGFQFQVHMLLLKCAND